MLGHHGGRPLGNDGLDARRLLATRAGKIPGPIGPPESAKARWRLGLFPVLFLAHPPPLARGLGRPLESPREDRIFAGWVLLRRLSTTRPLPTGPTLPGRLPNRDFLGELSSVLPDSLSNHQDLGA